MRDVWVTVWFSNWETRGEPFGTLPEVCNSSFGWQPLHLVACSEVLPSVISTFLILRNWLGTSCTKLRFLIVKQTELFKTLQTLISQGIVEKSQSPHYSQILTVPKPDGTFRMCVDYRALNDCTADASLPIPNIAEMFRRIGSQKPKILGIMDLTQGYHQAPLTLATRAYTSFITFSGVYQFTRLPFGPKRAPSYFQ